MTDLLDKFTPGHLIGLVATIGGILGWIITTVAAQWRKVRVAEIDAALKQQMLERGMGPSEIDQVLRSNRRGSNSEAVATPTPSSPKAAVVKALTDGGYEGADMERILRAFGRHPDPAAVLHRDGPEREAAFNRAIQAKVEIVEMMAANGNEAEEIERVLLAYPDDAEWQMDRTSEPVKV
jgi:hypothetical protein